ncbi:MAG: hypothetical protein IPL94_00750 [Tetrasphaera sp.]|nr:hypothetical protein [Tetrasphaera sp.]
MTDLVAGVDSSTQSCKVVVCDAETGEVCRSAVDRGPGVPRRYVAALTALHG